MAASATRPKPSTGGSRPPMFEEADTQRDAQRDSDGRQGRQLVRIPDVTYVSWSRIPDGGVPRDPVPSLTPELAVEVLSRTNTEAEMDRKRQEYFAAGVRLVWLVDPRDRAVRVYSSAEAFGTFAEDGTLDGREVLSGFALPLRDLFAEIDRHAQS